MTVELKHYSVCRGDLLRDRTSCSNASFVLLLGVSSSVSANVQKYVYFGQNGTVQRAAYTIAYGTGFSTDAWERVARITDDKNDYIP